MRLVLISDTHRRHARLALPEGDLLIHAGDFCSGGRLAEIAEFDAWLGMQPHRHKVVIAGNHDLLFERDPAAARALLQHATYLEDGGVTLEGLCLWGSPWQPRFMNWAFNLDRGAPLRAKWAAIPDALDVLITHGPPHGVLDRTWDGRSVGCEELAPIVAQRRPRLHVFGHIHEAHGRVERDGTTYVNAAICDGHDRPTWPPVVVDL